jgi:hypothetical protein
VGAHLREGCVDGIPIRRLAHLPAIHGGKRHERCHPDPLRGHARRSGFRVSTLLTQAQAHTYT